MAIFTVFQITALNENERVITEIYDKQLEAILFSVNQYSQDLIDAWAGDIDDAEQDSLKTEERMVEFLLENEAVSYILWSDSSLQSTLLWSLEDQENSNVKTILTDSLKSREEDIARLRMFQKEGYLRKEPLGRLGGDSNLINQSGLIFMLEQGSRYQICLLVLDPQLFITQTLAQKIQSVAQFVRH